MRFGTMLLAMCLWACGDEPGATGAGDTDVVSVPDADAGSDTIADVAPETVADAEPETVLDVEPETVADAAPETVADVAPETVADAAPETVADVVEPAGWVMIQPAGVVKNGSADLAIAPDGTLYAVWAEDVGGQVDVVVSGSSDGGATWAVPTPVDGADVAPLVATGRQPYLTVTGDTLYVTMSTDGASSAAQVLVYEASTSGPLSFTGPAVVGADPDLTFVDYPKLVVAPDGDLWVTFQAYEADRNYMAYARESDGWALTEVWPGNPGVPCECCRLDLRVTSAGDLLLAFRNNIDNIRDIFVAKAPAGATSFSGAVAGSSTNWEILACPMQGPRLAELGDGTLVLTWTDGSSGADRVWTATSTDGGDAWSGDAQVAPGVNQSQGSPTITVGADGRIWLTLELGFNGLQGSLLTWKDALSDPWAEPTPVEVDGLSVRTPTVKSGAGMTAIVGVTEESQLVFRRLDVAP